MQKSIKRIKPQSAHLLLSEHIVGQVGKKRSISVKKSKFPEYMKFFPCNSTSYRRALDEKMNPLKVSKEDYRLCYLF